MAKTEADDTGQSGANYPPASHGSIDPRLVRVVEKMYLTIHEASQVSGLTEGYLQGKIDSGELRKIEDQVLKIRRSDIERL